LVLLVIFMVTAPMTTPGVVDVPKVGNNILNQPKVAPVFITVTADGAVTYQEKKVANDELLFEIKQQVAKEPDRAFVISADKKVAYERVAQVLGLIKQAGGKAGLSLLGNN
jgi:biopolymer transport protein TolR